MKKKILILLMAVLLIATPLGLIACGGDSIVYYTVKFDTGTGGSAVKDETVQQGKRLPKPSQNPTNEAGQIFVEWLYQGKAWQFDSDLVTGDMTLTARWRDFSNQPTDVEMISTEAFSSSLMWYQAETENTTTQLYIKAKGAQDYVEVPGEREVDTSEDLHVVVFTPDDAPAGGYHNVKIVTKFADDTQAETIVKDGEGQVAELLFKGKGTSENPYIVTTDKDILAVISDASYSALHYIQYETIGDTITITNDHKLTFSGTYDGNGKTVPITGNGGLFYNIAQGATVKNLTVSGTIAAATDNLYAIGGITNDNKGTIDNCKAPITVSNGSGTMTQTYTEPVKGETSTGGGGIAGVNSASGVIKNSSHSGSSSLKVVMGGGAMAAHNYGLIEDCSSTATPPAGNQVNSGGTINSYSFVGGMVGFNYGTVRRCTVTGRVFAQSAVSANDEKYTAHNGKQKAFGGIAGYNGADGIIEECAFTRTPEAKEFIPKNQSAAVNENVSNIGVASIHGDIYVGGISGINAGTIKYSYVSGAIIGGRDFIGGIAGKTEGNATVTGSYALCDIMVKDVNGVEVTAPNARTTLTKYEIAPDVVSGGAGNNIFVRLTYGADASRPWVPTIPTLSAEQIALLNTDEARYAADGSFLWATPVTSITLNITQKTVTIGDVVELIATVLPENATNKGVIWTTSDAGLATVSAGEVTTIAAGTVTITATTRSGGHTATCVITIEEPAPAPEPEP